MECHRLCGREANFIVRGASWCEICYKSHQEAERLHIEEQIEWFMKMKAMVYKVKKVRCLNLYKIR